MSAESSSRRQRSSSRWIGPARRWPGCATGISTGAPCCACGPSDRGASMAKLTVSVAGVDYDRTRALFDGTVPIAGCETICCAMSPEEAFHRAFRYQEFDITESSLSNSMALVAQGANAYVAIPVFPSRLFRHSSIYVRSDRGIERPEDLRGKVIGVPEYAMTAAVWIRGILQDEYGVRAADVKWRSGGLEQPGREARVALTLPAVRRLFPDYRAAEEAYFERTRMFPIMHVVGIRRSLLERHPWLAVNTYAAYQKAKEICYRQLETIGHLFTTLPWPVEELVRARALMGDDFWSYGVELNRRELAAVSRYAVEQGITDRELARRGAEA